MAKKKSPNAALVESLKPAKPIPYDPELMQALADADRRAWQQLETLRREVYRHVMPTVWTEVLEAERAGDPEKVKATEMRADRQWRDAMGVPAITSFPNLEILMATVEAAGYPATDAGLHAWTIAHMKIEWEADTPSEWAKRFGVSLATFSRMRKRKDIRVDEERSTSRRVLIHCEDVRRHEKRNR